MMKKMLTTSLLCTIFAVNTNASRWEVNYLHDQTHAHYCALCFTKAEADDFKGKLSAIMTGAGGITAGSGATAAVAALVGSACPPAAAIATVIAGAITGGSAILKSIIEWNTSKGTGFSINIPSKMLFPQQYGNERGFMGMPLVPFVWESNG